jgi:DUF4097 and DUF4098 domain-containing protein YvlB
MTSERRETFVAEGPIHVDVVSKSGDITVQVVPGDEVRVALSAHGRNGEFLLENAEVRYDDQRNELTVRTQPSNQFGSLKSLLKKNSWMDIGSGDLDVTISIPQESTVHAVTGSGDTVTRGQLGAVMVTSGSGDINVGDTVGSLDARTGSGDVVADQVVETLACRCASGEVRCLGAATTTEIHTASGDVVVSAVRSGEISVKAVSGDVRVYVTPGLAFDVNGTTVSGDLGSSIPLDASDDADPSEGDDLVSIKVVTVSGDFRIAKAS